MAVLDDLRAIAEQLDHLGSEPARFLAHELRLVEVGCERATAAVEVDDHLGGAMWKRLAVESTLRVAWIVGDELKADTEGELILDRDEVVSRCQSLQARDLLNLLAAYKSISASGGSGADPSLIDGLTQLAASHSAAPAPRSLSDLAVNTSQSSLYSQHRLCSAVVHPGELSGDDKAQRMATRLIDQVAVLAVAFSGSVLRALR